MRILHVISTIARAAGGPTRVLADMSEAQLALGHDVVVVAANRDHPADQTLRMDVLDLFDPRVDIKLFKVDYVPLLVSFGMMRYLLGHVREFDIVHIHGSYRFPPSMAGVAARLRHVPYMIRPHGSLDPYLFGRSSRSVRAKRIYEKFVDFPNFDHADGIQFTAADEQVAAARFGFRAPAIVVPNGIRWREFSVLPARGIFRAGLGVGPDQPLILFLGRVNFKKGLDLLVPAFADIRQKFPAARLAIVGADNEGYAQTMRDLVNALGLEPYVSFVGMLNGRDVLQAYVDADLFVLPSYGENFGMAVIEALACGTPVVISDRVNIHQDVTASGAGVAVPCDIGKLASAILELLERPENLKTMGARGRLWVEANYGWSNIVHQLDAAYLQAIAHHKRRVATAVS